MNHVQFLVEYANMVVNSGSGRVYYCYYFDVNHAFLLSPGKKKRKIAREEEKKREIFFFAQ
jgi:hypothetical protein